ncbi:MAG: type IV pilus modification PilV family protein [Solirubrobacterales bacterium]
MDSTRGLTRRRNPRQAGTTLTEVVVASTLLLVSIIPLVKAMTTAHGMDRVIERKSWSLLLAQQELERVRARSIYHYDESLAATSAELGGGFLCTIADDENPSLRTVTVAVGFDLDGDGALAAREVEVRLYTALARRWPGP